MPCGSAMTARIFNKKKLLSEVDVIQPTMMRINQTIPGERYLLRITAMNSNDEIQRCRLLFHCLILSL